MRFKKQIAFLFGAIAMISYLSVRYFPQNDDNTPVVSIIKEEGSQMQVYLLDQDETLVPLSIEVNEEWNEEDKLRLMVAYMSGKQQIAQFQPLFQDVCNLENVALENGIVTLNFDDTLKNYTPEYELRVLEALTWGACQFPDIKQVRISMNGEILRAMPNANTPIPEVLNRNIGINHFETASATLHTSREITVFCTKRMHGQVYMVPKSRRVPKGSDDVLDSVNQIVQDVSVTHQTTQPLFSNQVQVKQVTFENGVMVVDVNGALLDSSKSIKQDVYNALVLSLSMIEGVNEILVKVDGVMVSPFVEDTPVSGYDLLYNQVKF